MPKTLVRKSVSLILPWFLNKSVAYLYSGIDFFHADNSPNDFLGSEQQPFAYHFLMICNSFESWDHTVYS